MNSLRTRDFNALNDLLFKYVFGHSERQDITIAFLNAVLGLEGDGEIVGIEFADREIEQEALDEKQPILDILCLTADGTQINIEVQVKNQHNMEKRTLYYWAKLYQGSLKRGDDYKNLRRTIAINLMAYPLLPQENFHNVYGVYDLSSGHRLNDDLEIHFLEMPKFKARSLNEMSGVEKWMAFFKNDLSDAEMEELAMQNAAINSAWDAADAYLADLSRRRIYEAREKAEHDYISNMNGAREEGLALGISQGISIGKSQGISIGISQGAEKKAAEIALKLLRMGHSAEEAAELTGISLDTSRKLARDNGISQA